jgi:hypothetical protein
VYVLYTQLLLFGQRPKAGTKLQKKYDARRIAKAKNNSSDAALPRMLGACSPLSQRPLFSSPYSDEGS